MFTMEIESNFMLPFLGIQLLSRSSRCGDQSECQTTNIGLLLHYKSHVDVGYKRAFAKNYMLGKSHNRTIMALVLGQCLPTFAGRISPKNAIVLNYFFPAKVP